MVCVVNIYAVISYKLDILNKFEVYQEPFYSGSY